MLQQVNIDAISEIESIISCSVINDTGKSNAASGSESENDDDPSNHSVSMPRKVDDINETNRSPTGDYEAEYISSHHDNEKTRRIRTEKYVESQAQTLKNPIVGSVFQPNTCVPEFIPKLYPPYQQHTIKLTIPFHTLN